MTLPRLCWLTVLLLVQIGAPAAVIAKDKSAFITLSDWAGEWSASAEQTLTIVVAGDGLVVEGFATWGAGDPERVERGGVNMGELYAEVPASWIVGRTVAFVAGSEATLPLTDAEASDCQVTMTIRGTTLKVEDNRLCGGLNVTFTGDYQRVGSP